MSEAPTFSRRALALWIAAAVVTFAAALYLMTQREGEGGTSGTIGPSTFSRSAIGYAGIAEVLRRLDISATKSRYNSLSKLSAGSLLVVAEPQPALQTLDSLRALIEAKTVLLILPKWQGSPNENRSEWIGHADLLPESGARWLLDLVANGSEVVRQPAVSTWSTNRLDIAPTVGDPIQLIRSAKLRPVVAGDDGMLLGELVDKKRRLWVLADPDVMSNHGIGQGENAAFAVALINALRGAQGTVVFDETVHGFVSTPASPALLLFQYPFVVATVQAVAAILLLLWATVARFGAVQPAPPPLAAGKAGLIQNAAALVAFAGHQPMVIRRYVQATMRTVARQLHAPPGLSDSGLVEWLNRVGKARSVALDCAAIVRRVDDTILTQRNPSAPLMRIARDIHQWKREIIDGPATNPRSH